jgi:hypothetical protein
LKEEIEKYSEVDTTEEELEENNEVVEETIPPEPPKATIEELSDEELDNLLIIPQDE